MLIIKGGISREIEEKNLQEYIDKGYTPVVLEETKEKPKKVAKE